MTRPFSDEEIDMIVVRAVSAFIASHLINGNATAINVPHLMRNLSLADEALATAKAIERYILEGII